MIEVIGFDADDTLWHNESYFALSEQMFRDLVAPYTAATIDLDDRLHRTEIRNLDLFGYGIKGFTLSMIETAIEVTDAQVPASVLQAIIERGKQMLLHPVELLDGVEDVVTALAREYDLILITKGDLLHQEQKVAASGLGDYFRHVDVVSEKDPATYAKVLQRHGIAAERFCMVGNSVKSDVLPVLALGGRAVHIPYELTWGHEHAEHDGSVPTLGSMRELPGWLAEHDGA